MNKWTYQAESDTRVVGSNPEMADVSNPRGEIIDEVPVLVARHEDGQILASEIRFSDKAAVEATANLLNKCGVAPVGDGWSHRRHAYGSKSFRENGGDLEMMDDEEREGRL